MDPDGVTRPGVSLTDALAISAREFSTRSDELAFAQYISQASIEAAERERGEHPELWRDQQTFSYRKDGPHWNLQFTVREYTDPAGNLLYQPESYIAVFDDGEAWRLEDLIVRRLPETPLGDPPASSRRPGQRALRGRDVVAKDLVGHPDIILVWPEGQPEPDRPPVPGYSVRSLPTSLDDWWIEIHQKAVPAWGPAKLRGWLERYRSLALPEGILVATEDGNDVPLATAGSIANSRDGMFPDGGQLAWVATVPDHRGRGLGTWLSALATSRLIRDGFRKIFLCTGDDLLPAIRIYLALGYQPWLYASDQPERWARICEQISHAFEPDRWPDPPRTDPA